MKTDWKKKLSNIYQDEEEIGSKFFSRLSFLGSTIFEFTTYDQNIDELLAKKMIEVLDCILNETPGEYHGHGEASRRFNYINYLTMVNIPFLAQIINWGTSIRLAWLEDCNDNPDAYYNIGCIDLEVPVSEIKDFIRDLIEWSKES